jgi:hypothetical protein
MRLYALLGTAAVLGAAASPASALTVTPTNDAATLINTLLPPTSGISIVPGSETLNLGMENQQGSYSGFRLSSTEAGQPALGLPDGVVLTTGTAEFSTTTNTTNYFTVEGRTGPYQPLVDQATANGLSETQFDSNVLSFDFTVDDPTRNSVSASFIFATDEFPTQSVTDIMAVFVNGENFAFFPNGDLVSNQSEDPNEFFNNNPVGDAGYPIEWNGLTDAMNVIALINPGEVNTFTLAIADTQDQFFDSALFMGGLQAGVTGSGGGIAPIPVPAALPLMLTAIGSLAWVRRRKKAATA